MKLEKLLMLYGSALVFSEFDVLLIMFTYGILVCGCCREDIDMTVRLVINCNGMKVNAVKE